MQAPDYLCLMMVFPLAITLFHYQWNSSTVDACLAAIYTILGFAGGLCGSIIVYRTFFHSLGGYPGPVLGRVSKLYHFGLLCRKKNNFELLAEWHAQYGPVVRVGPSELSLLYPDALPVLYGARSKCYKSPWYDSGNLRESLQTVRSRKIHDERRKLWSQALSGKVMQEYEERLFIQVHKLMDCISEREDEPLNMTKWINYFSFDVMSDLAFGNAFGMLSSGKSHFIMNLVHSGQKYLSVLGPVPWLTRILLNVPGATGGEQDFRSWCRKQVKQAKKDQHEIPHLMGAFLKEANKTHGDCRLVVIAGSDTTASTLVHLFYYLALYPEKTQKLRQELLHRQMPPLHSIRESDLQDIEYLSAFINETLRLHPPTPSGLLRVTSPEGIMCGEHFIPGETTVSVPFHGMGRSELVYARPSEFIPERWSSEPHLVRDKMAYMPFGSGSFGCVGKRLALMELRAVTALMVLEFDICLAPGEDGSALLFESLDAFTLATARLDLVFHRRVSQHS